MIYIALLRAVNLAGYRQVAMGDLRSLATRLGFEEARTLLQSGNLVFRTRTRSTSQLERLLETEMEQQLGLQTEFFVRTPEEWQAAIDQNPFREEAERDPSHLVVTFLKQAPAGKTVEALQAAVPGRERIHASGRHLYIVFPDGIGRSKLTSVFTEKRLGTRGTARNWNTVLKLAAAAGI